MDLEFSVEVFEKIISEKLKTILNDVEAKTEIHNVFAKMCDPWVPFLEGPLSQTVEIHPDYIRYIQPYARYQYVGINFNHTTEPHQLATAYWDKAAMQAKREVFEKDVKDILIRRAREIYG